jgi:hypothetical protein
MTTREEEMAMLKARYARQMKGGAVEETKKPQPQEAPIITTRIKKPRINLKPYIFLVENDIRKLFRLPQKEWKTGGLKFEELKKPLNLGWLEKRGGKLF